MFKRRHIMQGNKRISLRLLQRKSPYKIFPACVKYHCCSRFQHQLALLYVAVINMIGSVRSQQFTHIYNTFILFFRASLISNYFMVCLYKYSWNDCLMCWVHLKWLGFHVFSIVVCPLCRMHLGSELMAAGSAAITTVPSNWIVLWLLIMLITFCVIYFDCYQIV